MLNIAHMGDRQRLPEALIGHYLADGIGKYPNMCPGNDSSPAIPAAFQDAMLQCLSPRPGEPEVLMIYPCWPDGWHGSFQLWRGAASWSAARSETARSASSRSSRAWARPAGCATRGAAVR